MVEKFSQQLQRITDLRHERASEPLELWMGVQPNPVKTPYLALYHAEPSDYVRTV